MDKSETQLATMKPLADYTLADHLEGPHEWGYRDPVTGDFVCDDTPYEAAAALRQSAAKPDAGEADLYVKFYQSHLGEHISRWSRKPFEGSTRFYAHPPAEVSPVSDEVVERAAKAIATNGFGRPWDDFHDCSAHDTDKDDLREYARAALSTLSSRGVSDE